MRAVCYCRTSTLDQAREDKVSIQGQVEWARNFTKDKGWDYIKEYIEPGVTGDTEPKDRKALSTLLEDAGSRLFDIVLVYHSSRLAREPDIGMRVCRLLGEKRIQVYFRNSPIEPISPDRFVWGVNIGSQYMTAFSFIGDFQENVARGERVRSGFLGLAKRGKLVFAPYGYKKLRSFKTDSNGRMEYDWQYVEDPSKALIVKRIFNEYTKESKSLRKIMLELNSEKIPSPSGKVSPTSWTATTIRNILTNPTYIGKVRWGRKLGGKYTQGKTPTSKQKRQIVSLDKQIIENGTQPPLISEQIFYKTQDRLKLRYQLHGRAIASDGLLTGLVICGLCGKKAYYKTRRYKKTARRRSDYMCQTHITSGTCRRYVIAGKKLHDMVIENISKISRDKLLQDRLFVRDEILSSSKIQSSVNLLMKRKEEIQNAQDRLSDAYLFKTLGLQEYDRSKKLLDAEYINITNKIADIQNKLQSSNNQKLIKAKFRLLLRDFSRYFNKAKFQEKKDFLQKTISSVVVQEKKIRINYRVE